jgi:hypothetical protein
MDSTGRRGIDQTKPRKQLLNASHGSSTRRQSSPPASARRRKNSAPRITPSDGLDENRQNTGDQENEGDNHINRHVGSVGPIHALSPVGENDGILARPAVTVARQQARR